jgi:ABC-type uncharacterized transport system ATPase subunit
MSDRIGVMVGGKLCRIIANQGDARAEAGRLMAGLGPNTAPLEAAYVH